MGFFGGASSQSKGRRGQVSAETLHLLECKACPLNVLRGNQHPHMAPTGSNSPTFYVLGDAPNEKADEAGEQFVGKSGRLLRDLIPDRWDEEVRWNNVVRTRPPGSRTPSFVEIECFPAGTRVGSIGRIKTLYRRFYNGPLVTVKTANGRILSGTPNHPVFLRGGRVPLGAVVVGDSLLNASKLESVFFGRPNRKNEPTTIDEIFNSFSRVCEIERVGGRSLDFHGDGENSYVDIIRPNCLLGDWAQTAAPKLFDDKLFAGSNSAFSVLMDQCPFNADRSVLPMALFSQAFLHFVLGTGSVPSVSASASISYFNASFSQGASNRAGTDPKCLSEGFGTDAASVFFDDVVEVVRQVDFSGHVYNLETESHAYIAQGLLVSNCCRPSVIADIERTKPKVLIGCGPVPLAWVSGRNNIDMWRGRRMPVKVGAHVAWFYPIQHPEYVARVVASEDKGSREVRRVFEFDIARVFKDVRDLPVPRVWTAQEARANVKLFVGGSSQQLVEIEKYLASLTSSSEIGMDFETNCLRPYSEGSKILSVAFGDEKQVVAIALDHPGAKWTLKQRQDLQTLLVQFLLRKDGPLKYVHNLAFEQEWTATKLSEKALYASRWRCSMVQAAVLDERAERKKDGPLGLDFLCRQHFGVDLKILSNLNRAALADESIEAVLLYNGMDAKFHKLLGCAQQQLLEDQGLADTFEAYNRRIPTLTRTQIKGVPISTPETLRLVKADLRVIDELTDTLRTSPEAQKFKKATGRSLSPSSNTDLLVLFKDVLGDIEAGDGKKLSVDEDALVAIGTDFALDLLDLRKAQKRFSTYEFPYLPQDEINRLIKLHNLRSGNGKPLDVVSVLHPDGCIHPVFNSVFASSGRLSCESPNIQNLPKRKEEGKKVRKHFVAPPGQVFFSVDYGQIEHRVAAMLSQDATTVRALWEGFDVHGDWAQRLAHAYPSRVGGSRFINDKIVMKEFRGDVKNQWTFPLIFGATLRKVASVLRIPEDVLRPLMEEFWEEFAGLKDWQENTLKSYWKNGYVETALGWRRRAPLSPNQIYNSPIQGTACELIMDRMAALGELEVWDLQPNIQIHDDLTFLVPANKASDLIEEVVSCMLKLDFDFINVPITVEVSMGKTLYSMEEVLKASSDTWRK